MESEFVHGLNPAFEVIRAGRRKVRAVYLNQAQREHPRLRKLAEMGEQRDLEVIYTDKQELFERARTREHQGVVVETGPYPYRRLEEMDTTAARWLVVDNVEDPHNLGALMRSAEIFGFRQVFVPMRGSPGVYASVVKASAGASEYLDVCMAANANKYIRMAQENGYRVMALESKGKVSLDEAAASPPEKVCLVIGGEDRSVGQFILNIADDVVSIPQTGRVGSLNASVAAGIAMYALRSVNAGGARARGL